jgi:uncharacterized protein (TIGR00730 family)
MQISTLCVYCGSSPGWLPQYAEEASSFGALLASNDISLVYGGGNVGLMGAVADGALQAGGKVVGVIPKALVAKEVAHQGLTDLRVVDSMHERKLMMTDLADGFVALPGGVGTIEEIFEMVTWGQLGLHTKPCAFLNIAGFYDHLFRFLRHMTEHRFLKEQHLDTILMEIDGDKLISSMRMHVPKQVDKWIDRKTT